MADVAITAYSAGGRALRGSSDTSAHHWLSPEDIDCFATQNRKSLRYLNRGSIVTAALIQSALAQRGLDGTGRRQELSLLVGTAFGNEGETLRYFEQICELGPCGVGPMASYDVACNSFVNFCSIFFHVTATVRTMSNGACSTDVIALALNSLAAENRPVVVACVESESRLPHAYCGSPLEREASAEAGVVMVLERATAGEGAGLIAGIENGFAPSAQRRRPVLERLLDRLFDSSGFDQSQLAAVFAGPAWSATPELLHQILDIPDNKWVANSGGVPGSEVGATGLLGCVMLLRHFEEQKVSGPGLVVTGDPGGSFSAILVVPGRKHGASAGTDRNIDSSGGKTSHP